MTPLVRRRSLPLVAALLVAACPLPASAEWDCRTRTDGDWSCSPSASKGQARPEIVPAVPESPAQAAVAGDTVSTDESPVQAVEADAGGQAPAEAAPREAVASEATTTTAAPLPSGDVDSGEPAAATPRAVAGAGTLLADEYGVFPGPDPWALCPPTPQRDAPVTGLEPGQIDMQADTAQASGDGNVYTLTGNAVVDDGARRISADSIVYRQDEDTVEATGNLHLSAPGLIVEGDSGVMHPDGETGRLQDIDYLVPEQHGRGSADSVEFRGRDFQHMDNVSYTTCPPGDNGWLLSSASLDLDHAKGTGTARDAKLRFKDVPVFYSPYLSFPLDDRRKSGFLFPRVGHSESTGTDISIPYYWNIAPHRDATIAPRYMSDRGLLIGGEFRYKNRTNQGILAADYLPSDDKFDDEDRSLVSIFHTGQPVPRLETRIKAANASDDNIFDDFGTTLVQTSKTNIERTGTAEYHGNWWDAGLMVRDFQVLEPDGISQPKPYKQLPKVWFEANPDNRPWGLKFSASGELDYFRTSDDAEVEGQRLDLLPRISYPVSRAAWYVEPAVGLRYTLYDLDNVSADQDDSPDRTTPIASLDAGTFFERTSSWGDTAYVQTLEPRLFYLYVPGKDQDDLPVFDTGNYDFNHWTLFRDNRFTGPDRMGDANQLALAVTTRFLDPGSGRQWLSASLGGLFYFSDREVTLPDHQVQDDDTSDVVAELLFTPARNWRAGAEYQWDPHESRTERSDYHVQYHPEARKRVNLSYRQRYQLQEQVDLSFLWPLSPSWHAVGRWYYSLKSKETIEAIAGLGYESCCWGVQLVGRSYVKSGQQERVDEVFLQLELKGLGKLGTLVDDVLERGILDD